MEPLQPLPEKGEGPPIARFFLTIFLLSVVVISTAQFYYLHSLELGHIATRSLVVALSASLFVLIKERTEHVVPYPLLYFTALLLFSYLLLTNHPAAVGIVDWLFGPMPHPLELKGEGKVIAGEMENVELALAIHREVNRVREQEGLPPYSWDEELAYIAYLYAKEMAEEGFFSHYKDGEGPLDRYAKVGYRCERAANLLSAGENLFRGEVEKGTAKAIVESWLSSTSHRANVLSKGFEREGIGVYEKDGILYVVQNFC